MIKGVGVDMCSIERMKRALGRPGFRERVFCREEIEYADMRGFGEYGSYAASFAAREAFAKAGGWGIGRVGLKSVHVRRVNGVPVIVPDEHATELMEGISATSCHLSITHERDYAVAVVILEG